uniref:OCA domain-containing protein n=1 Tax=Neolamprologus brichardi TaxID=32507 RepID=A0A3Q4GER2_NEOBR
MLWKRDRAQPSAVGRSRPYQGVRVRDPVKELLRRKRSLELYSTKTLPPTGVRTGSPAEVPTAAADGGLQCAGWKATPSVTSPGLQAAAMSWSTPDYNQQDPSAQTLTYPATPTLTMQTLCPSYTMLTYTHTPLLTNFGVSEKGNANTIPVAPAPASLPQVELQDSGLAYLPWAQPLTAISTMPNHGVQFAPGSAALPGSPLILEIPEHSEQQDHKERGEEEDKDSYRSSLFIPNSRSLLALNTFLSQGFPHEGN